MRIDLENNNNYWRDAIHKEMSNAIIAFQPYCDENLSVIRKLTAIGFLTSSLVKISVEKPELSPGDIKQKHHLP